MELRSATTKVYNLDHLEPFIQSAPHFLRLALADSHAHCGEGFAGNDRGTANRSFVLSKGDGVGTPHGPIETLEAGPKRPFATTWLSVPTALGAEALTVNCVKPLGGDRWKLVRGDVGSMPGFVMQPGFLDDPEALVDFMLGIQWRTTKRTRGAPRVMHAKVYLLGGRLDCEARIFHSKAERLLLVGSFGEGGPGTPIVSEGPTPPLVTA